MVEGVHSSFQNAPHGMRCNMHNTCPNERFSARGCGVHEKLLECVAAGALEQGRLGLCFVRLFSCVLLKTACWPGVWWGNMCGEQNGVSFSHHSFFEASRIGELKFGTGYEFPRNILALQQHGLFFVTLRWGTKGVKRHWGVSAILAERKWCTRWC